MMPPICTGWAYEECNQPPQWCLYDEEENRSWTLNELCTRHVAMAFADLDTETVRPYLRAVARIGAQEELLTRMWSGDR